jgi:hypothetical protein
MLHKSKSLEDFINLNYKFLKIILRYEDDGSINEYDKKTRWYPKLFIENALDNVKEEITYSVTHVEDKCMITETRIAKGYFWER